MGEEKLLESRGVKIVVADNEKCYGLMQEFIKRHPEEWNEDIGEE
jgi:cytosine/creatinine deaminase